MATTNGETKTPPSFKSIDRVASIPVVSDSIAQLHAVVTSTNVTTKAYNVAESLVKTGYSYAEPLLGYGSPLLERADGIANQGLDFAESKFPYPFQTKTDQIVADAKKPADQAYGVVKNVYDNRIAPMGDNAIVQRAYDTVINLNQQVQSTYSGSVQMVTEGMGDAQAKAQALINALINQLYELKEQGPNIPAQAKENLSKAYSDLSAVITAKDKPVADKTKEVISYIQDSLQPLLDSASKIINATKEKAVAAADEGADKAQQGKAAAKDKAQQGKKAAKDTANGVVN
jgi:hypothetical protein